MIKRGGYLKSILNRLGLVPKNHEKGKPTIWIHAASVGEIEALNPLINRLVEKFSIYLTTITSTGFNIAKQRYGQIVPNIAYFPIDFYVFSRIAWRRINPCLAILMESELWPEHLCSAKARNVPVMLINARCSDKSFKRYLCVKFLSKILLKKLSFLTAASELDALRWRELGCDGKKISIPGNLKIDAAVNKCKISALAINKKELWEEDVKILLGASTWPQEEEFLVKTYINAKKLYPNLRLILIPRHVERCSEIVASLRKYDVSVGIRSKSDTNCDVYLANTTGELSKFILISDIVFVGKSLFNNHGGQTPIESAAAGKPILYGENMENFKYICSALESANGAIRCKSPEDAQKTILEWLDNPHKALKYGNAAYKWIKSNVGSTEKTFCEIIKILDNKI